jgi:Sec1 family
MENIISVGTILPVCPSSINLSRAKEDFSNVLSKSSIEQLAEADSYELVREIQEFFADYSPLLPYLFSLNHIPSPNAPLYGPSSTSWDPEALKRSVHGISAVLLSLKKKPVIRYERMSVMARKLGSEIKVRLTSCSLVIAGFEIQSPRNLRRIMHRYSISDQHKLHRCFSFWIGSMILSPLYCPSGRIKRWFTSYWE